MKKIIIANWKMHKTTKESVSFAEKIKSKIKKSNRKIILCPPFTDIASVSKVIKESPILLGAQNVFYEKQGAFTGEVSPVTLKELGVSYVIIGHSERRKYFRESDKMINKKIKACLQYGLLPILCIGENKWRRRLLQTKNFLKRQLTKALSGVKRTQFKKILIAYEPLWAIGTGKADSAEDAERMHCYIRYLLARIMGSNTAQRIPILYGGSVNQNNSKEFLQKKDINGLLVGRESLIVSHFAGIVNL